MVKEKETPEQAALHDDVKCDFCGKYLAETAKIIAGSSIVDICVECMFLCERIILEDKTGKQREDILLKILRDGKLRATNKGDGNRINI